MILNFSQGLTCKEELCIKKHNNIEAHLNQVNKLNGLYATISEQQSRIEELTKALEWKDRIISDLKEKINNKSPF